ncbi:hypothetical protein UA08_08789 [Talaromyces atroroseus]|uniref:Major facilitator superfamily (MFS) profile domain-containing protein n=1 Tax=Talaromyces atroroseus TaxID=1441469 RepID=A0A225AKD8_TALAT|nr:hypothetical protein UA08_08789 [Talaromyces atroroseus]OKL55999.1 hypothetical protein UA08_08789 [Talaromyces atroroseus]
MKIMGLPSTTERLSSSSALTLSTRERHNEPTNAAESKKDSPTLETFEDQQDHVLPHRKLMVVFPSIAMAEMIAFLDQTMVSTALPAISSDLNLGASMSWVATSFLIASSSIQLINGRLSDIFGRKSLLLTCISVLAVSDLCAGFAQNSSMLFAFRTLAGLGGGALTALVMIIASDITTLEQRGRYNGFIGAMNALGNGLGPIIGGVFAEKVTWRWCFWSIVPLIVISAIVIGLVVPPSNVKGNAWAKFRMVDWLGLCVSIAAVVLTLVPISQSGSLWAWNSVPVILMLTIGGILAITFVLVEWKLSRLPIMPIRLFQSDYSANLIFVMATMQGIVYYSNIFYVPLYLQNVRGYTPIKSGAVILPMVMSQGFGSLISGQAISRTGHYKVIILVANIVWLVGVALQIMYNSTTPVWAICLIGLFEGIGIGCTFQPSLVALLAHSRKADRAVANSLRNFVRITGGSVGLTVSGTILNNVLESRLQGIIPSNIIAQLSSSTYSLSSYNLTPSQTGHVITAYMDGLHVVFLIFTPLLILCCICAVLIQDHGVAEKDARLAQPSLQGGRVGPDMAQEHEVGPIFCHERHSVQNEK